MVRKVHYNDRQIVFCIGIFYQYKTSEKIIETRTLTTASYFQEAGGARKILKKLRRKHLYVDTSNTVRSDGGIENRNLTQKWNQNWKQIRNKKVRE